MLFYDSQGVLDHDKREREEELKKEQQIKAEIFVNIESLEDVLGSIMRLKMNPNKWWG